MADIQHNELTGLAAIHQFALASGSDPGAIGAYKAWLHPGTGRVKIRNASNSDWITPTDEGSVPLGGDLGEVLTKITDDDGAYDWAPLPEQVAAAHGETHEEGAPDPIPSLPTPDEKDALLGVG